MLIRHFDESTLDYPVSGVKLYWLVGEADGAENFATRLFELNPGACTPYHNHPWEHQVFIIEGEGAIKTDKGDKPFATGDALFVKPNENHQFRNTGDRVLRFICVVPVMEGATR